MTFSQIVKGVSDPPPRVEVAGSSSVLQLTTVASKKTAALGSEPTLGESSSPGVDATENPLVNNFISFMNVKFKSYEDALGSMIEKVAAGEKVIASLRQQASLSRVEEEERVSSPPPQSSQGLKRKHEAPPPPFSPKRKGIEFATDEGKLSVVGGYNWGYVPLGSQGPPG